jgi:SAM-dependent methyltransferase
LAEEYIRRGDDTGWFEELYRRAEGNPTAIPWVDLEANPNLVSWAERTGLAGAGRLAINVGCGLGDDAEELSRRGFEVTAFDIAPTAIEWCRRRFPESRVDYQVADLFNPPESWVGRFDFVLESYTLQSFLPELRPRAMSQVVQLVAPGGTMLVICRGREQGETPEGVWPVPIFRKELGLFQELGLREAAFEDFLDGEEPLVRRFRVRYFRP